MLDYIKSLFNEQSTNSLSRWLSFFAFIVSIIFAIVDIFNPQDLSTIWIAFLTFGGTVKVGNKVFEKK